MSDARATATKVSGLTLREARRQGERGAAAFGAVGSYVWQWAPWLLVAAVFATRLPFMTETPYAFDSANFSLAVRDYYNVAHHRPHPPGYPLYVFIAQALNTVVGDPNRALVLEGIGLSALAVASTAALARSLYGPAAGILAGTLLVFTVGFWGYGEVAYAYVGLAAEMATIALLAHWVIAGRQGLAVPLGIVVGLSAGIRWDGAVFTAPLWLWAAWCVSWRLRATAAAAAALVIAAWAVPMVSLTGGPMVYLSAVNDYLRVWAPQSAYVVGDYASGQSALANFNLTFFVNYARQMLGVGILTLLYLLGRRFGPAALATDYRSRLLAVWIVPPVLTYIFTHLGEAGYVLSLAPAAAVLVGVALLDLGGEMRLLAGSLLARGWRWLPSPQVAGRATVGVLLAGIVAWNVQAFLRGVGPGRLPDLRARDATTMAQVELLRGLAPGETLVLAHDTLRQMEYYLPDYRIRLQYSEYLPNWEAVRERTELPAGTRQVVVLDGPLLVPPEDARRVREVVLREQPQISAWLVDVGDARTVEHGYRWLDVLE